MTRFFQFGTSRFLQAHADLFIDEGLGENQVCVVQSSGNAATRGRLEALAAPEGYPVAIRGLMQGRAIDRRQNVRSIACAISTSLDWEAVKKEALDCQFIISNVSEKGYVQSQSDTSPEFSNAMSFPAKLLLLLVHRCNCGHPPPVIMPLELFESNGTRLKDLVLNLAERWALQPEMVAWLGDCIWVNSLVDRIVSKPLEPAGAVTEPYALWAIQKTEGLLFPFIHPAIKIVDDLSPYQLLKLYILNLSHSYMAFRWKLARHDGTMPDDMTVRQYMEDEALVADLMDMQSLEILPGFSVAGLGAEAESYVAQTLDRFRNPFLDHHFRDIIDGHAQKVASRAGGFLKWARASGDDGDKPRLARLLRESERVGAS